MFLILASNKLTIFILNILIKVFDEIRQFLQKFHPIKTREKNRASNLDFENFTNLFKILKYFVVF